MIQLRCVLVAILLVACIASEPAETTIESPETIELTIEIVPPPQQLPAVEVFIAGVKFFEQIEVSNDPVVVSVSGPGRYLLQVAGVIEESTSPTTGCSWYGPPTWVEVSTPTTVELSASQTCA